MDRIGVRETVGGKFKRLGNAYHLLIENSGGLAAILDLDEAHWVATTAPVSTINADAGFLRLLDSDEDGRIRAEEIKDAIRFLLEYHQAPEQIRAGNLRLELDAVNRKDETGQRIGESAAKVLRRLEGREKSVTLEQIRRIKQEVLEGGLDQAGIVLPEAAGDEATLHCISDLLATVGGSPHPCGKEGVDRDNLARFLEECRIYLEWRLDAGPLEVESPTVILPLGEGTAAAYQLYLGLRDKLIQYFLLCDIKRLNPELLSRAMEEPEANVALNLLDISEAETYLVNAPLATLNSGGELDLFGEGNPYFRKDLETFAREVVQPLLGDDVQVLDRPGFQRLREVFQPYLAWQEKKPEVSVEGLDFRAVAEYVKNPAYRETLEALIVESHRTAFVLENLRELERLTLYQGYLLPLVNSFVSFPHLYDPASRALFEMGTLVMDGRHFTLAVRVDDRERHIETVKASNIFVMYLELFGGVGEKAFEVAVPVTSGDRGNIHLGKWGIFNDINGKELHAQVVDIVENPISVREAMVDPFVRMGRSVVSRLEEFSSKAEEKLFRKGKEGKEKKKEGSTGGLLAGGGIAAAAMGSSFAFITQTLAGLSLKVIVISLAVTVLLITVPAAIATYYRLSRRDLSTILEGSGWGMNARMRLTGSQAKTFTLRPPYSGLD